MNEEQIIQLAKYLSSDHIVDYQLAITKWFEQNPTETVVAGLISEPVPCFYDIFPVEAIKNSFLIAYKEWAKTQNCAQPKSFQPDWSDAPEWANWFGQCEDGACYWYSDKPVESSCMFWNLGTFQVSDDNHSLKAVSVVKNWKETLQQRPASPTPSIAVDQIWSYGAFEVRILGFSDVAVAWQNAFTNEIAVSPKDQFLSKYWLN